MRTQAQWPVQPAPLSGVVDAGTHVHQLLHLAHALTHTNKDSGTGAGTGSGSGSGGGAGDVAFLGAGVGVDVAGLSDRQCLDWARDLEQLLHFGQALAVQISGELGERYTAGRYADTGARGQAGLLVQVLHLSAVEATRRLKLAAQVLPATDTITGEATETTHPHLAEAFFTGSISQESASTVGRYLADTDRLAGNGRITADEQTMTEHVLVDTAKDHGPDFIRQLAHRILSHLDPDGQQPSTSDLTAKQGLFFRQPRRGLISFHGHLTIEQHEHLMAAIGHATNPNKHHTPDHTTTNTTTNTATTRSRAPGPGETSGTPPADRSSSGPCPAAQPGPTQENPANKPPPNTTGSDPTGTHTIGSSSSGTGNRGGWDWGGHLPGQDPDTTNTPPWTPKTVDGVTIPAPGSTETLPGLDPTDPHSTDRAVKDTRTHGQKLLDGLINCLKLAARTNTLPINGGLKPQLILSCTQQDLNNAYPTTTGTGMNTGAGTGTGTGWGTGTPTGTRARAGAGTIYTSYNGPMPIHLFDATLCDPEITTLTYSQGQTIINAGRTQRLFTPAQRKLLFARDLGCTFPDCTAPAPWCEAHHITPWQAGGPTNLNNAALLCSHHHTLIHTTKWTATIRTGTPHYTPPWHLDPTQTPRKNNYHHAHTPQKT